MLISFAVTVKLICVFVFAYAKRWFSHDAAHITSQLVNRIPLPRCFHNRKLMYFFLNRKFYLCLLEFWANECLISTSPLLTQAKKIDFNPLREQDVSLPDGVTFVISNCCVEKNKAASSDFNTRVVECRIAAQVSGLTFINNPIVVILISISSFLKIKRKSTNKQTVYDSLKT